MRKIPQLSTVAQRSLSLSDIPTPEKVAQVLTDLRRRRADIADVFEFMALTGIRWGEARAARVSWMSEKPLPQLDVDRSHSDRYAEKDPKSWRGTRSVPLSPRAVEIFRAHAAGKRKGDYLFTNTFGAQLSVGVARKFPLGSAGTRSATLPRQPGFGWVLRSTKSRSISATIRALFWRSTHVSSGRASVALLPIDWQLQNASFKIRATSGQLQTCRASGDAITRWTQLRNLALDQDFLGGDGGI